MDGSLTYFSCQGCIATRLTACIQGVGLRVRARPQDREKKNNYDDSGRHGSFRFKKTLGKPQVTLHDNPNR
jgi:hypothetical protein